VYIETGILLFTSVFLISRRGARFFMDYVIHLPNKLQ
jgi:hypothetical protein